jgi:hypothetical protein
MNVRELYNLKTDAVEAENVASMNEKLVGEFDAILREWDAYVESARTDLGNRKPDFSEEQIRRLKSLGYL